MYTVPESQSRCSIERLSGTLRYFLTPSQTTAERLLRNLPPPSACHASSSAVALAAAVSESGVCSAEHAQPCRATQISPRDGSGSSGPSPSPQKRKCGACGCDVWQWLREECVLVAPRVPSYISPAEFCDFLAPYNRRLLQAKVLHGPTTAEYLVLLHCNRLTAVEAIATFNGVPLLDGDSAVCELRIVKEVVFAPASPLSEKKVSTAATNGTAVPPRAHHAGISTSGKVRSKLPEPSTLPLRSPRQQFSASGEDSDKRRSSLHLSEREPSSLSAPGEGSGEQSARRRASCRSVQAASDVAAEGAASAAAERDWSSFCFRSANGTPLHPAEWGEAGEPGDSVGIVGSEPSVKENEPIRARSLRTRKPCGGLQFFLQRTQEDTQQEFCAVCLERVQIPPAPYTPTVPAALGAPSNPLPSLPAREADDESHGPHGAFLSSGPSAAQASGPAFLSAVCTAGGGVGQNAGGVAAAVSDGVVPPGECALSGVFEKGGGAQGGAAPPGVAVTVLCGHSFHSSCLRKWSDPSCPVCRYQQHPYQPWCCFVCGSAEGVRACLLCGFIGCGDTAAPSGEQTSDAAASAPLAHVPANFVPVKDRSEERASREDGSPALQEVRGRKEGREPDAGDEKTREGRRVSRSREIDRAGKKAERPLGEDRQPASEGSAAHPGRDEKRRREEFTDPEKTHEERNPGGARGENFPDGEGRKTEELQVQGRQTCFTPGHSRRHFEETSHPHALELGTDCVWDFVSEGYVHLVVQKRCQAKAARLKKAEAGTADRCGSFGDSACAEFVCATCVERAREAEPGPGHESRPGGDATNAKEALAGSEDTQFASLGVPEEGLTKCCCVCGSAVSEATAGEEPKAATEDASPLLADGRTGTDDSCPLSDGLPESRSASLDASVKREHPGGLGPSDGAPCTSWKKVSGWVVEFNQMLAASLDSQRDYYEDRLHRMAEMYAQPLAECQETVMTAQQTVADLEAQVTKEEVALAARPPCVSACGAPAGARASSATCERGSREGRRRKVRAFSLQSRCPSGLPLVSSVAASRVLFPAPWHLSSRGEPWRALPFGSRWAVSVRRRLAGRIQARLAEIEELKQQIRDVSFHVQASASLSAVPEAKARLLRAARTAGGDNHFARKSRPRKQRSWRRSRRRDRRLRRAAGEATRGRCTRDTEVSRLCPSAPIAGASMQRRSPISLAVGVETQPSLSNVQSGDVCPLRSCARISVFHIQTYLVQDFQGESACMFCISR
ncbi:conserved hypothetical protein [Neospora caninum Liverpool]|uniref:RING-type domain-containing protein n=1 Tax=Neospora caninum (strain Liverpool) TaxID=572307 RepID=F0VIA0_NEOCL|nr:conserved hypothetical protein [Neospora caninum Liverpool]CBZ53461.1 conserved hypothetical protein [Neospora caninum Liverpool]|eukprot:XP_003883493.1 conserved hypothetical protein [Neospora caninum Liverpool]